LPVCSEWISAEIAEPNSDFAMGWRSVWDTVSRHLVEIAPGILAWGAGSWHGELDPGRGAENVAW